MTMADLNGFDWTLIAVVAVSMIAGFRRGLVRTVLGIAGFIGGFLLASWDYERLAVWLLGMRVIRSEWTAKLVAFLLLLALVGIGAALVDRILRTTIRASGLGYWDRTLGAGFGLIRGCIFGIALLMVPATFAPQSKLIKTSVLIPYLFEAAHDVSFLVPH
jgi:membrane protein required for colicin V production